MEEASYKKNSRMKIWGKKVLTKLQKTQQKNSKEKGVSIRKYIKTSYNLHDLEVKNYKRPSTK